MEQFAKLFESNKYGQILVKNDQSDEGGKGREVRFYFTPEHLGVCSVAVEFEDDEVGIKKADKLFNKINKKQAIDLVAPTIERMNILYEN